MQNVYDIAHDLVRSLKESDQYKNLEAARAQLNANPELKNMLSGFQEKSQNFQMLMMSGQEIPEDLQQQLQQLSGIVMADPTAANYLQCQMTLSTIVQELVGIIADVFKEE